MLALALLPRESVGMGVSDVNSRLLDGYRLLRQFCVSSNPHLPSAYDAYGTVQAGC